VKTIVLILGLIVPNLGFAETFLTASVASYHFKRADYCEVNPGIGFEHGSDKWRFVAGTYQNSLCNPSNYIGVSYSPLKLGNWRIGTALLAITGYEEEKKKRGERVVIAPLPLLSYEGQTFGFNLVVIPPYDDFRGALGLQAKVRF
jgi:hypothetical protein